MEAVEDRPADDHSEAVGPAVASASIIEFGRSNLHPTLLESLSQRYTTFTDIQRKAIPLILSGKDVLIKAQTGSGKTLAALVPVANYLYESMRNIGEVPCLLFYHF
uniref:ATP-dependent RNA helicase n=1 Tax=Babesia bovis TaxID=5865 RepID=S6B6U2_BABBO|nr:hypothetical protein [Babesia bovis]